MTAALGVMVPPHLPPTRFAEFTALTEQLGFDALWLPEDCFYAGGIAQAATALATTTLNVGIGILPATARNVAFTAMEVGFLASAYPGRLSVGIGHGMSDWLRQVDAFPASPLTLLGEYLDALRALLAGAEVTVQGRYVTLAGVRLAHPPALPPPVLAGVRGPKSLALSGTHADGTILAEPVTPGYLRAAREAIAPARDHQLVAYNVASVDPDPVLARSRVRPALWWTAHPAWAPHFARLSFADELAALRKASGSPAELAQLLPDAWVDELALVGSSSRVRDQLDTLAEAGADQLVLTPVGADPLRGLAALGAVVH